MNRLEQLRSELLNLNEQAQVIQAEADAEGRALSAAESREIGAIFSRFEELNEEISRREKMDDHSLMLSRRAGRMSEPQPVEPQMRPEGEISRSYPRESRGPGRRSEVLADFPRGFQHPGEMWRAVAASSQRGGSIDPRLIQAAPTTYGSEGVGADGGFAVPPSWSRDVLMPVVGEGSLISLCDVVEVPGNTYVQIKDEGSPWSTSGGIQAYWGSEAGQLTQSKPSLKDQTNRLHKLTALIPVTEELMEDAPSLDAYLRAKTRAIFDFKVNLALVQGTGAGQPLGILNSSCLISVAKESGQLADTIQTENIMNMWSRLAPGSEGRCVWLAHKDIAPQLFTMSLSVGTGGAPVYLPANSIAGAPYQTLMGRPIIWSQACETLGDQGDIILADMPQYRVIMKTMGMRTDVSMHLWFDYDMLAYRFVLRIDGAPLWSAAVSARDGSNTYSPFVTLAERA